jgi:hypothetical protein
MAVVGRCGPPDISVGTKRSARPSPRPGAMVRRRNWRELTARSLPRLPTAMQTIMVSRAYGLSFGCLASTHQAPYRIVDPNSCPAPRCRAERLSPAVAAPGSCLPGAPIVWDTRPFMGETQGVAPGLWQGSAACSFTMRILTRSSNRRLEDYAKMAL